MCVTTGLVLAAGRFGLAPTANRLASAGGRSRRPKLSTSLRSLRKPRAAVFLQD